ncbi:MAG: hypothetical protein OGM09_05495 [Fusobacterium varium]|uniref:hypothetical protein n=1 Tax=Fusobacterium varium TaxID=856 RepID=UPI0024301197|nr:hypothetical protein [Fusobacterium varium]UYI79666.1 MAG: hypothetical protein OGM09_05495 [Fusobacterium varium]
MNKKSENHDLICFKTLAIPKTGEELEITLKEIKNKELFSERMRFLYSENYFQSEKVNTKKCGTPSDKRLFLQEVSELFNLSNLMELSYIRYAFGEKYYSFLFKPLFYNIELLPLSKKYESNCILIDDNRGFKDCIELGYCNPDHLSYKEVLSNIAHIERIQFIALILQCAGFLFEIISLDDFILNPILGLCLSRYQHIKQLDEKVTNILRCPKCHTSMELDLKIFREKVLRKQEAHYSCPSCKTSSSYTKLLKTYETNKKNSYNLKERLL